MHLHPVYMNLLRYTARHIEVCIKEIDGLLTRINDANANVSLIKDGVKCQACGTANVLGDRYCKKCGSSIK